MKNKDLNPKNKEDLIVATDNNKKGYVLTRRGKIFMLKIGLVIIVLILLFFLRVYISEVKFDFHAHLNG